MDKNKSSAVTTEYKDGAFYLEFYSEKANSLSRELILQINNALKIALVDFKDLKTIVITAKGDKVFSSGANLDEYKNLKSESEIASYLESIGLLLVTLMYYPVPVVSIVKGKTVGGGLGLIAASDYVIASTNSSYRLSELTLGVAPLVISPFLTYKIGNSHFNSLCYSTEWKDSNWALRTGLVSEVVDEADILNRTISLVLQLTKNSITPVKTLKEELLLKKELFEDKIKHYSRLNAQFVHTAREKGLL